MKVEKRINKILRFLLKEKKTNFNSEDVTKNYEFLDFVYSQLHLLKIEYIYEMTGHKEKSFEFSENFSVNKRSPEGFKLNRGQINLKVLNYRRKFEALKKKSPELNLAELDKVLSDTKAELESYSDVEWVDNLPYLRKR